MNHDFVYHALFGNTVKFLVPTISLVVFSVLIIREVCFSKLRVVDPWEAEPGRWNPVGGTPGGEPDSKTIFYFS
jgi:hypothetical protein